MIPPIDHLVCVDFETSDSQRDSACSVAMVRIKGGQIVGKGSWYIRPPRKAFTNTPIHKITWEMCKDSPSWRDLWLETLLPRLEGVQLLVAHSAAFDRSVMKACQADIGRDLPPIPWACTVLLSKACWPGLTDHKLPTVCAKLRIPLEHHKALSDAVACAQIALEGQRLMGSTWSWSPYLADKAQRERAIKLEYQASLRLPAEPEAPKQAELLPAVPRASMVHEKPLWKRSKLSTEETESRRISTTERAIESSRHVRAIEQEWLGRGPGAEHEKGGGS